MEKKRYSKLITLTSIVMCVIMLAYVATMFVTINEQEYSETKPASEFINGINDGEIKLKNEDYDIAEVTCVSSKNGPIDLSALSGSDTEIRNDLISKLNYTVISEETNKAGDKTINVTEASDDEFSLKWTAYTSTARLIWFPSDTSIKNGFIPKLRSDFYKDAEVEYDINDVVLFPVLMFVLGVAGAVLMIAFSKRGFFLLFPIAFCLIGLIGHISGLAGLLVPQMFIYTILNALAPTLSIIQLVLVVLTLATVVASVVFRKMLHNAIVAEEAAYYAETK